MCGRLFVAVAGTPGVGKTIFSKLIAGRLNARLIDLKKYAIDYGLVSGVDEERDTLIVNEEKLGELLSDEFSDSREPVVAEGILSPFTPATHVIVLRCAPRELARRLGERNWGREKIRENIEAEVLGVCLKDSMWCENILELDATKQADVAAASVWLKEGGKKIKPLNWFNEYTGMLEEGF